MHASSAEEFFVHVRHRLSAPFCAHEMLSRSQGEGQEAQGFLNVLQQHEQINADKGNFFLLLLVDCEQRWKNANTRRRARTNTLTLASDLSRCWLRSFWSVHIHPGILSFRQLRDCAHIGQVADHTVALCTKLPDVLCPTRRRGYGPRGWQGLPRESPVGMCVCECFWGFLCVLSLIICRHLAILCFCSPENFFWTSCVPLRGILSVLWSCWGFVGVVGPAVGLPLTFLSLYVSVLSE